MLHKPDETLDALIRAEKERVAQEIFEEAWDSAATEGIEPQILAEQAITLLLKRLHKSDGEQALAQLIDALPDKLASGHFLPHRILQ